MYCESAFSVFVVPCYMNYSCPNFCMLFVFCCSFKVKEFFIKYPRKVTPCVYWRTSHCELNVWLWRKTHLRGQYRGVFFYLTDHYSNSVVCQLPLKMKISKAAFMPPDMILVSFTELCLVGCVCSAMRQVSLNNVTMKEAKTETE